MFFSCGKAAVWLSIQSSFFTKKNKHTQRKQRNAENSLKKYKLKLLQFMFVISTCNYMYT